MVFSTLKTYQSNYRILWLPIFALPKKQLLIINLNIVHIYRKTVVVGAGYIAVELAGILQTLGSETSLLIRYDKVIYSYDK